MMLKRFFVVIGMLLLTVGGPGSAAGATNVAAGASAAAATPSQTLLTIACPSVTDCYAGGNNGTLLATHDGGATWQSQPWEGGYRKNETTISSIACPSARDCFARVEAGCEELGAQVPFLHTTDGGSHWNTTIIDGCGSSLACPTVTTCYTILSGTAAFVRTTDSGSSWQVQTRIDSNSLHGHLACPTPAVCYVAYQSTLGRSTDGGKHWSISRILGKPCAPDLSGCPASHALVCPGQSTCYAGGAELQNGRQVADVISTRDGFRSLTSRPIPGLLGITDLSCPTPSVCVALGGLSLPEWGGWFTAGATSRVAVTDDGGEHWRLGRIAAPYPFNALACASVSVCDAAGFLGRLTATKDGGATWHDLTSAIFVSGTYGGRQPLHTYSSWFTATVPWRVAVGTLPGPMGPKARLRAVGCGGTKTVDVYVRNAQGQVVAGPIRPHGPDSVGRRTVPATGKLRLDVVTHCSGFSVRVDGVGPAQG